MTAFSAMILSFLFLSPLWAAPDLHTCKTGNEASCHTGGNSLLQMNHAAEKTGQSRDSDAEAAELHLRSFLLAQKDPQWILAESVDLGGLHWDPQPLSEPQVWMLGYSDAHDVDKFMSALSATFSNVTWANSSQVVSVFAKAADLAGFLTDYPKVAYVEEDGFVGVIPEIEDDSSLLDVGTQGSVPWGVDRVDAREGLDDSYDTGTGGNGAGVHVYVLDTGIRTTHNDFGGRAHPALDSTSGIKVCSEGDTSCAADGHGHGTHCAGSVGGLTFGVAKGVNLYGVKVLSDQGGGTWSGVIN
jgi:hypothetical protein